MDSLETTNNIVQLHRVYEVLSGVGTKGLPMYSHFFPHRENPPNKVLFINKILGELERMKFLLCRRKWKMIGAKSSRT